MSDIKRELIGLHDFAFARLRTRLEELTDDEYFWAPAPNSWTIHPDPNGTTTGDWGLLFGETPPVTTLAWRLSHIIDCIWAERCATWLRLEPIERDAELPATAAAAVAGLDRANEVWRGYLDATSNETYWAKLGPIAGEYADDTIAAFVLHILDELIHHGAEVALLRDLYREAQPRDAFVDACLAGDRDAVAAIRAADPTVVERSIEAHPDLMRTAAATGRMNAFEVLGELGFSVDASDGRNALHHVAGAGDLAAIKTLIDLGADVNALDPIYQATPLGWAEYMRKPQAADLLRPLTGQT